MFNYFVTNYGTQLIGLILCAVFGCIAYAAKQIARTYLNDETKLSIARTVVRFVEQVWTEIHGQDKLKKALETAEGMLRKKNIPFDADEMMVLIEAAVQEMNEVFQKATEQQLPVKAGDYVGPQDSGEAEKVPAEMA